MSYDICLKAHRYWLSTIREFVIPLHLMENLSVHYQEYVQTGLAQQQKGEQEAAQVSFLIITDFGDG